MSSPSSSSSSSSSSFTTPLPLFCSTFSSSPTTITATTATASLGSGLTPESYLAHLRAHPTSAEKEIGTTAHRLYVYLTLCPDRTTRASHFRRLVRLCLAHPQQLLGSAVPTQTQTQMQRSRLMTCPECSRTSNSLSPTPPSRCCWYLPDARQQAFLDLLVTMCRDSAELFGDDVSLEQFMASFRWE